MNYCIEPIQARDGIFIQAPAKLNLFLEVLGRRSDGYHEIETIFQAVDLYDDLTIGPADGITVECSDPKIPTDERNTVTRAAKLLQEQSGTTAGARIRIRKRIPSEAGMGGGSSNAAAALLGLNLLWDSGRNRTQLADLAIQIGADVPFFLGTPCALGRGLGERLTPIRQSARPHFVVHFPSIGLSTPEVYRTLDAGLTSQRRPVNVLLNSLSSGDLERSCNEMFNCLETPAKTMNSEMARILDEFKHPDFLTVRMTGSGSTMFGICRTRAAAQEAELDLRRNGWRRIHCLECL